MSFTTLGDDIAVLLDHLEIPQADLVGHSFGGISAIRAAIQQPEKVRRLVVISSPYARSVRYPEVQRGMSHVSAAMAENMNADADGQVFKAMARAAALSAVPRQDGQYDELGLRLVRRHREAAHAGASGVRGQRLCLAEAHCGVLHALVRRHEGAWLAEHAAVEVAAGGRAWLQSLQFHNLGGGAADYRQVPGRSAHEGAGRGSCSLAGRAATGEEAAGLDQKPERIGPP